MIPRGRGGRRLPRVRSPRHPRQRPEASTRSDIGFHGSVDGETGRCCRTRRLASHCAALTSGDEIKMAPRPAPRGRESPAHDTVDRPPRDDGTGARLHHQAQLDGGRGPRHADPLGPARPMAVGPTLLGREPPVRRAARRPSRPRRADRLRSRPAGRRLGRDRRHGVACCGGSAAPDST